MYVTDPPHTQKFQGPPTLLCGLKTPQIACEYIFKKEN